MASRRLNQYRGRLTAEQTAKGMAAARENANRLFDDAKLLMEAERWASALACSILALEEFGKASLLRGILAAKDEQALAEAWRDYRTHTSKTNITGIPPSFFVGPRHIFEFEPLLSRDAEHPILFEKVKQLAMYSDCLSNGDNWSTPSEVATEDLCRTVFQLADYVRRWDARREVDTAERLEQWRLMVGRITADPSTWREESLDFYGRDDPIVQSFFGPPPTDAADL